MRWRRVVAIIGLVAFNLLAGGCADEGTGVAGPVPKETVPAKPGGERPTAEGKTLIPSTR